MPQTRRGESKTDVNLTEKSPTLAPDKKAKPEVNS